MKKILNYRLALIVIPLYFNSVQSQSDRFAYAVTALAKGGTEWIALRKLDTRTGVFSDIQLNLADKGLPLYDLSLHEMVLNTIAPNSGVAAIAYDRNTNRIFYVPMNNDQLRYIDLVTMDTYTITDQSFSKAGNYIFQKTSPITRLVIAPDKYGYTITNDGDHLIRFTTNGTPVLTDLGTLIDDPHNNEMTIHSACANAGGDMIADDAGNLYLITAGNRVFKVAINTKMTTYLATISGLPASFTTNGAAVDENGKLIVSSSVYSDASFIVDPKTWKALQSPDNHPLYGIADLASSNVLLTKPATPSSIFLSRFLNKPGKIKIFPDPVLFDEVSIQFNEVPPGNYTIQLADLFGRRLLQQKVKISANTQTEILHIPSITAQGFYYIRVLNEKHVVVSTHKLAVERW